MDDKKKGNSSNRKWIVLGVVISTVLIISVFATLYFVNINNGNGISYTWYDRSSGECEIMEGTYHGKSGTLYLNDDKIDAYTSARFHYTTLIEGSITFYFLYEDDIGGDITMEFYSVTQMFSTLDHIQDSLVSNTWYLIVLTFDCATNSGEVWIDGTFISSGAFTIRDSDGNDGFVIRTDTIGMIKVYISMVSITG